MNKKNVFLILIMACYLISCSHHSATTDKEIDVYCQRLNVLLLKVSIIASNIVNISTTRTPEGGPYKRKIVTNCHEGFCSVVEDTRAPLLKYEPNHPDANKNGYVAYPDISLAQENADRKEWESIYADIYQYAPVKHDFFLKNPKAKM